MNRLIKALAATAAAIVTAGTLHLAVAESAPEPPGHNLPVTVTAQPQEDEPGWNCHTMGNHLCGPAKAVQRVHPTHITGHWRTGWHVWWSDGHESQDAPWGDILAECRHDPHPGTCVAVWAAQYRWYGITRAVIRSLS